MLVRAIVNRAMSEERWIRRDRVPSTSRTVAGVAITPDNAITIATVWACLRYLSQTVAVLPWHAMRKGKNGAEIAELQPVNYLLSERASPEWSSFQFRETLVHWALRWGNGYAEIEPDTVGRPFAMWPIHPERVCVCRAIEPTIDVYGNEIQAGEVFYEIDSGMEGRIPIHASRVFHLRGFGEGPVGVNVITYAAQSLGWARAAQLFGAAFFGNGLNPSGVVVNKKALKPDGLQRQRDEFNNLYGGPTRAHRTAHLDNDATWQPITFNAKDAQLIEVHQHMVEEICRWMGCPPHKVMHLLRATNNNIEHQGLEAVVDHISPWVKRLEDEANFKLCGGRNRPALYSKMNMRALMRGDMAGRAEFYKSMFGMGAYSPNDILALEDENGIGPAGDQHLVQMNLAPLERVGQEPAAAPAADNPTAPETDSGETVDSIDTRARIDAIERVISDLAARKKRTRTIVTRNNPDGSIAEFEQEEITE